MSRHDKVSYVDDALVIMQILFQHSDMFSFIFPHVRFFHNDNIFTANYCAHMRDACDDVDQNYMQIFMNVL